MKELTTKSDIDPMSKMIMTFGIVIVMLYITDMLSRTLLARGLVTSTSSITTPASQYEIPQSYYNQPYFGAIDPRVLDVIDDNRWMDLVHNSPHIPWIAASFFNDGPDSAFIAINYPSVFAELRIGESTQIDLTGAVRRIEVIFYKCNLGDTASVRVVGKY